MGAANQDGRDTNAVTAATSLKRVRKPGTVSRGEIDFISLFFYNIYTMKKTTTILLLVLFALSFSAHAEEKTRFLKKSAAAEIKRTLKKQGIEAARKRFKEICRAKDNKYKIDEKQFIKLGDDLRVNGDIKNAVEILKLTVQQFPESPSARFNLAQLYIRDLKKEKAVECYKKSLELQPKNNPAQAELGWLELRYHNARLETREKKKFQPGDPTGLHGPYLGHTPPGLTPKKFAPGLVSTYGGNEYTITFSPDGKEIYFQRERKVLVCRLGDKGWTAPKKTNIPGLEIQISPQSGNMYINKSGGIWVMEPIMINHGTKEKKWGEPEMVIPKGMFATVTGDETLYTTVFIKGGNIGRFVKKDGKYGQPEVLGPQVNASSFDAHPCIAPDESFLIFDSDRPGKDGVVNLYVCFRQKDGSWSKAAALGPEVNMPGASESPSLSPDGKYLFYSAHNDIYWVETRVIGALGPE